MAAIAAARRVTKVMHVITGLQSGGAEGMLTRIVLAQGKGSYQIVVSLTNDGIHGAQLRAAGVEVHSLGMRRSLPSPRGLLALTMLMRRAKPDVVMTWLYHADLAGLVAAILSGLGSRRVVWNLRCSNMDFSHYSRITRWVVALLVLLSRVAGAVAVNSRAGQMHHASLGYRPCEWMYLPNGFDLNEWRPDDVDRAAMRTELGLDRGELAVGLVARVDPMKDHATFFAAAKKLVNGRNDLRFVLIGQGTVQLPVAPELTGEVIALGERRDVPRLLRALDLAVLSSAFGEGFPNAVAEAMASGLPCVVTDVGDAAEIVGDTGVVVSVRSANALAHAIEEILREPEERRRERRRLARQRITNRFSLDQVAGLYRECWDSVARSAAQ
jgi:glycosyltransferase involved in cell wall biosynthesis